MFYRKNNKIPKWIQDPTPPVAQAPIQFHHTWDQLLISSSSKPDIRGQLQIAIIIDNNRPEWINGYVSYHSNLYVF